MIRTQIYLTENERSTLALIGKQMRKSQSELIREAIDSFCEKKLSQNRIALLRNAKGIWRDRKDLPDFVAVRKEFDRLKSDPDKE